MYFNTSFQFLFLRALLLVCVAVKPSTMFEELMYRSVTLSTSSNSSNEKCFLIGSINGGMMQVVGTKRTKPDHECLKYKFNAKVRKDQSLQLSTLFLSKRHCNKNQATEVEDDNIVLMAFKKNLEVYLGFNQFSQIGYEHESKLIIIPYGSSNKSNCNKRSSNCKDRFFLTAVYESEVYYISVKNPCQFSFFKLDVKKVGRSSKKFRQEIKRMLVKKYNIKLSLNYGLPTVFHFIK